MNVHPVIMAGGSGTRFWPVSRRQSPKQLLPLIDNHSMLRITVDRMEKLFDPAAIRVVTPPHLREQVEDHLPELPDHCFIREPAPRDTAPCIGLAAESIRRDDPDGGMLVLPSDHYIPDESIYLRTIRSAVQTLQHHPEQLITFGITPDRPATGYGYIQQGNSFDTRNGISIHRVESFTEKPDQETAESYLSAGSFLWNSGMFLWKAKQILDQIQNCAPEVADGLTAYFDASTDGNDPSETDRIFKQIPATSIDYAVMEHANDVLVVESEFAWSDIGAWDTLLDVLPTDEAGNTTEGTVHTEETHSSIVYNTVDDHLVTCMDMEDMVIVHTEDATLICPLDEAQNVKTLVQNLGDDGLDQYL